MTMRFEEVMPSSGLPGKHDSYENPLIARYASRTMARLFSPQARVSTWRKLWVALAEAEQALGLSITDEQIAALRAAGRRRSILIGPMPTRSDSGMT